MTRNPFIIISDYPDTPLDPFFWKKIKEEVIYHLD